MTLFFVPSRPSFQPTSASNNQNVSLDRAAMGVIFPRLPTGYRPSPGQFSLPPPSGRLSNPPAGRGLQTGATAGFQNSNTITTSGGWRVVPGDNGKVSIYAPGQREGDKPHTAIGTNTIRRSSPFDKDNKTTGITESDGGRFNISKPTELRLPDGTSVRLEPHTGNKNHSLNKIQVTNGPDFAEVTGVGGRASTSRVSQTGYEYRQQIDAQGHDVLKAGGNRLDVQWHKVGNDGSTQGVVTGSDTQTATRNGKFGPFKQSTDANHTLRVDAGQKYYVDSSLRPRPGTAAAADQLRTEIHNRVLARDDLDPGARQGLLESLRNNHLDARTGSPYAGHSWGQVERDLRDVGMLGETRRSDAYRGLRDRQNMNYNFLPPSFGSFGGGFPMPYFAMPQYAVPSHGAQQFNGGFQAYQNFGFALPPPRIYG